MKTILTVATIAILTKWMVGYFPYSGKSKPPMYGDYEAQRHWMEITTNLPAKDWYTNTTDNDLQYWGLDYPPLTAYHMKALGLISKNINNSWVKLHESRGFESPEHKIFMRLSVLIPDVIIYSTGLIYYFTKTKSCPNKIDSKNRIVSGIEALLWTLWYPGQILIDHGHFQYNCIFMGMTVWSMIAIEFGHHFIAAIIFTLALNYKQMSLYYALPFFWYIFSSNVRKRPIWKGFLSIIMTGILVICTTALCFIPYLNDMKTTMSVIERLFPFQRGIYEDKVANFWYCLSLAIKMKNLYSIDKLLQFSLIATLAASLPCGIHLLLRPTIRNFKYSLVNTSLAFFLFSFQVHEKTILVPALPVLLLYREHPHLSSWFTIISTYSLHPLLIKDGLNIPYFSLMTIMIIIATLTTTRHQDQHKVWHILRFMSFMSIYHCLISSVCGIALKKPDRYPDAYIVYSALYSFAHFIMFLIYFNYIQLFKSKEVTSEKKSQ